MPEAMGPGWTDERVATLKRDWLAGQSALQIANTLGRGVTRNAVIGKLGRLGLLGIRGPAIASGNRTQALKNWHAGQRAANPPKPAAAKPVKEPHPWAAKAKTAASPKAAPKPAAARPVLTVVGGTAAPKPAPAPVIAPDQPEPRHLTLMQLGTGVCRWPIGDGAAMTFCGCATPDATDPVQPYCAFHRARAFQPRKPRLLTCNTLPSRGAHKATRSEMFRQAAGGR